MGDEYADRTGLQRHNYTREELSGGFSARLGRGWRRTRKRVWPTSSGMNSRNPGGSRAEWNARLASAAVGRPVFMVLGVRPLVHAGTRLAAATFRCRPVSPRAPKGERIGSASRSTTGHPTRQRVLPVLRDLCHARHLGRFLGGWSWRSTTIRMVTADLASPVPRLGRGGMKQEWAQIFWRSSDKGAEKRRRQQKGTSTTKPRRTPTTRIVVLLGASVLGFVGWRLYRDRPQQAAALDENAFQPTVENTRSAPRQRPRAWCGFPAASSRWAPPNRPT